MTITIILTAVISVVIYRIGLYDGQLTAKGEKIKTSLNYRRKPENINDREKLQRGIKNILNYGIEVKQ